MCEALFRCRISELDAHSESKRFGYFKGCLMEPLSGFSATFLLLLRQWRRPFTSNPSFERTFRATLPAFQTLQQRNAAQLIRYAFGEPMKISYLLLPIFLALPSVCFAELKDETLLQNIPNGYKLGFQTKKDNMVMTEMVPQAESVNDWTEMVTTQVFLGMKNATPEQFQTTMSQSWLAACKGGETAPITKGVENGYPFSIWVQACPLNQSTGKPETTLFKAIKGNDSFYVVQVAFRSGLTKDKMEWMKYLKTVAVCDNRLADRRCPNIDQVGP